MARWHLLHCDGTRIVPVPPALTKLRATLEPFMNKEDPKWRTSSLVVKYANLQGAITDGYLPALEVVTHPLELDAEFAALIDSLPRQCPYNTVRLEENFSRVFEYRFDTYADHFVTQTRNVVRAMRIMLQEIICRYCSKTALSSPHERKYADQKYMTRLTIDLLARDMCQRPSVDKS